MLIVGFNQYQDFYPSLVADNLDAQQIHRPGAHPDLPVLQTLHLVSTHDLGTLIRYS